MSITWLSLHREIAPGQDPASQPQTKTIYKYSAPAWSGTVAVQTTIDFKWEPFIMSVINDVPAGVTTRRHQYTFLWVKKQ